MKLMTKEIEKKLPALYSNDGKDPKEVKVVFKLFHPASSYTLYVTEGEKQEDGDWLLYGLVTGTYESELGYASLRELESVRVRGLGIERDRYFTPGKHTLEEIQNRRY